MHVGELLIPKPITFEIEIATEKLETYKSAGTNQITAAQIQAESNIYYALRSTNLFILYEMKNCHRNQRSLLLKLFI